MKKTLKFLVSATLLFTVFITPIDAAVSSDGKTATSTGKVTFGKASTDPGVVDPENPTDPVDPDDVEKPTDPEDGGPTGADSDLRIDSVPWFDFGSHAVGKNYTDLKATTGNKWSNSLQLSDLRYTDGATWSLNAKVGKFVNTKLPNDELTGTIKFTGTEAWSENNKSLANPADFSITSGAVAPSSIFSDVAATGKTVINWFDTTTDTPNDKVSLDIDASSATVDSSYIAEITWTLSAGAVSGN